MSVTEAGPPNPAASNAADWITVALSADRLAATLVIEPGARPDAPIEGLAAAALAGAGVLVSRIVPGAIADAAAAYRADPARRLQAVVATGEPPLHGTDGRVEVDPEVLELISAAASAIPPSLPLVSAGRRLGVLIPPGEAKDGADVLGRVLPAREGRPADFMFDASVRIASGIITAESDGLLEWGPGVLRVRNVLTIDGAVDRGTGDIEFPGDVTVRQGICDCSTLTVRGSLKVHGLVEAATLRVGGDAALEAGMAARQIGAVSIGGALSAKHLNNVQGEIGGDLLVRKEIVSCELAVMGRCLSEACALIGGDMTVARECELARLGSESWTPTRLVLGSNRRLARILDRAIELRPLLEARIRTIEQELQLVRMGGPTPSHDRAEQMTELQFDLASKRRKLAAVDLVISGFTERLRRTTRAYLSVQQRIFPGTRIAIGSMELRIEKEIRGPVVLDLDERGRPRLLDLASKSEIPLLNVARSTERGAADPPARSPGTERPAECAAPTVA